MIDLKRNTLAQSNSPYLRQHASNPVWWQEWRSDVLAEAERLGKPLFVSVGYATCHWCHVMAAEAFSDGATADVLNSEFVCIKVDREQRPDIDQYLMRFLQAQSGGGGWPLNAFLTAHRDPLHAFTYAPAVPQRGLLPLRELATRVAAYLHEHPETSAPFRPPASPPAEVPESALLLALQSQFDAADGGFGQGQKFPPHTTLLFLLHALCERPDETARQMCRTTLDAIRRRGLHDHLQGGLFRYCVDARWSVPHFEKMLYDQALALWVHALAYRVLGDSADKAMAEGIVRCVTATFERPDGLCVTGYDADTEHVEGGTYSWSQPELLGVLGRDGVERLGAVYELRPEEHLGGRIHLVRRNDAPLPELEALLLAARRKRPQPGVDDKVLCGQNALLATAWAIAGRLLGNPALELRSERSTRRLLDLFWDGRRLAHAQASDTLQTQTFLFDAAAMLLAVTLQQERGPGEWTAAMSAMTAAVEGFRESSGLWMESRAEDFQPVAAEWFDHPMPSSPALAELALARAALQSGGTVPTLPYRQAFVSDFHNLAALLANGGFHSVAVAGEVPWGLLPPNTLRVPGEDGTVCYRGTCQRLVNP